MTATERTTVLAVDFNGSAVTNAISARVSLGYDMGLGEASIEVAGPVPTSGSYYDDVTIVVNGVTWFSGILTQFDYALFPRTVTLQCKGRMWLLQQYKLTGAVEKNEGLSLADLMRGTSPTDENIVSAVLD